MVRRPAAVALPTPGALVAGLLGLATTLLPCGAAQAANMPDGPGPKGAQVYCFMRSNGNNHNVSWSAAYALIKRQSAGMFRTSPEHAAVMITEAVVQNPGTFPDCGRFLGDLFSPTPPVAESKPSGSGNTSLNGRANSGPSSLGGMTRSDRYGS
jgi:hypothetical protein